MKDFNTLCIETKTYCYTKEQVECFNLKAYIRTLQDILNNPFKYLKDPVHFTDYPNSELSKLIIRKARPDLYFSFECIYKGRTKTFEIFKNSIESYL